MTPPVEAPTGAERKRGFRTGFLIMLLLAIILTVIYIYAPEIAKAVPQADPWLSGFVAWVDQIRLWLDGQMQSLLTWLDQLALRSAS